MVCVASTTSGDIKFLKYAKYIHSNKPFLATAEIIQEEMLIMTRHPDMILSVTETLGFYFLSFQIYYYISLISLFFFSTNVR